MGDFWEHPASREQAGPGRPPKWRAWLSRRYSAERRDQLADKAERAVEVAALMKPEAEANLSNAEAIARLIEASSAIPSMAVMAGPIAFVKFPDDAGSPVVVAKLLSASEMRKLEDDPSLLMNPRRVLALLGMPELDPPPSAV
jgi:hypothetical protein